MARLNTNYDKRRNELMNEIWNIFLRNGYENTTLSLIIKELKISKGAFYHYFQTKESCADAVVEMFSQDCYEKIARLTLNESAVINLKNLTISCSKLFNENEYRIENINKPSNSIFHQKLMVALVKKLAPLYADVISQGVREKVFDTGYPLEAAQMILTLSNFFFDADLFGWSHQEMPAKLAAFKELFARTLKTDPELFDFLEKY
ncbi:TetR/AcrR family transcriptional regulator [Clostridium tetani]|uniref:TetR/AcrR family transcriptional regulator n=1 Tax=Clostridium tetani TaxID=1513 RepID=UPI00100AC4C5|nr:TetR/AcrR family transcriptional regulator [Clostridium tetani]RXI39727.1 TetR/AcrR family transcriptional regulator [Clostridium tetani]